MNQSERYQGYDLKNLPLGVTLLETKKVSLFKKLNIWAINLTESQLSVAVQHTIENVFYNWFQFILQKQFVTCTVFECGTIQLVTVGLTEQDILNNLALILNQTQHLILKEEVIYNESYSRFPNSFNIQGTREVLEKFRKATGIGEDVKEDRRAEFIKKHGRKQE